MSDHLDYGIAPPGFRLPAATRIGAVRLRVADLERSLAWYRDLLGFRMADRGGAQAALAAGDSDDTIVELHELPGASPVPRGGRPGLYHFAILLPERAALGRFVRHLDRARTRFGASDHLVSEALYLTDPDGHGIEVYADRPRATWRHEGGQLAMASNPLDLSDLVGSSDGEWSGMPPATVLGHVHLHVGDIDRAASFYHDGMGLDKIVWSYPGALFLSAGGYHHHLGVNTWASNTTPPGDGDARLLEWELIVPTSDSVHAALDSIESSGATVVRTTGDSGIAHDPWGTAVRIRAA